MITMVRRSVALSANLLTLVCFSAIVLGTPNAVSAQQRPVVYFHFAPDGCENCLGLAPDMERFYQEHGSEYDVRGIVIRHWGRHDATAVRRFVKTTGITFPIIGFGSMASAAPTHDGLGFFPQGEGRRGEYVPTAVRNADTSRHPVVQVYNPQTRVTRVASVGNVEYSSMVEQIEVISRGGTGSVVRGST